MGVQSNPFPNTTALALEKATKQRQRAMDLENNATDAATKAEKAAAAAEKAEYNLQKIAASNVNHVARLKGLEKQADIYRQSAHHARIFF